MRGGKQEGNAIPKSRVRDNSISTMKPDTKKINRRKEESLQSCAVEEKVCKLQTPKALGNRWFILRSHSLSLSDMTPCHRRVLSHTLQFGPAVRERTPNML